jgi:hypothetical protein
MIGSKLPGRARQNGRVRRNLTTHSTGARVSISLIVELAVAVLSARPVNSGVRRSRRWRQLERSGVVSPLPLLNVSQS